MSLDYVAPEGPPQLQAEVLTPVVRFSGTGRIILVVQVVNPTPVIESVTLDLLSPVGISTRQFPDQITLLPHETRQAELEVAFHAPLPIGSHELSVLVIGASGLARPAALPVVVEVPPRDLAPVLSTNGHAPTTDLDLGPPQLRADLLTPRVQLTVGEPVELAVRIHNTTPVIETVTLDLLSLMAESTTQHPERITLFPEESLQVELEARFHPTLPAGTHEGLLVVTPGSDALRPTELWLTVDVPVLPALSMRVEPPVRTGGRSGRFEVVLDNAGNTPLDVRVEAVDAERVCELTFNRSRMALRVDQHTTSDLLVRAKRKWTGAPVEHAVTVTARSGDIVETSQVQYRQKAVLTPGVITLLTLGSIVGLWALVMLFGIQSAFGTPDPVKVIPSSFHEGINQDHLDVALVGGSVTGDLVAASTAAPVERVTVEVFDLDGQVVTATASDGDGAYELDGLLPGRYRLRLRAPGFEERWWPSASDAASAGELLVGPSETAEAATVTLEGLPAALGGQVVAGDGDAVVTRVELVAVDLVDELPPVTVTTDENGIWEATGLVAPATYRIAYTAANYDPVEVTQVVGGGELSTVNPVRLPAARGAIAGTVLDLHGIPVGGVQIVAQRGDDELTTTTPTSGEIGAFEFTDLETPATYLLTFTAEGFAGETQAVRLEAGEEVRGFTIELPAATGTITGIVDDARGQRLGGVTVTVTGSGGVLTTDTLTSGDIGSFRLPGLALPGTYTVSFDAEGFERQTVQVTIDASDPTGHASATLRSSVGAIEGRVVDRSDNDAPIAGAEISISDGETTRRTTTASAPSADVGRFRVGNLPAGSYTITVSTPDGRSLTVMQRVTAAGVAQTTLRVR
ncbi:carboxypeptidase regulatory-like domain-containing protein [Nitriliruptor alkaliphilus]|uniref:carboxypeptidase regulatory-like domain-containing protein n=1 Tax=Nitriliruptor alkaliphilus TaxID=427918 RepID=UPI0006969DF5|nr:carboxypeptidase regulatory-like domain-containing protein [Nitriliruptor alkaliphilus]